jgi:hypothetical protein
VLGGLLRAKAILNFEAFDAPSRANFLSFFDQTFQRGGG